MSKVVPNIIVAIKAMPKSGKSHYALTFPAPMVVFSFDIGLEWVLKKFQGKDISVKSYPIPLYDNVRAVGFKKEILDIWNQFTADFKAATENPAVRTLVIDTATAEYELARIARTAELGKELDPVKYGDVYLRLKALIQRARLAGQNLVLTHYLKDVYVEGEPTGEKVLDGWRHTEGEVDVVVLLQRVTKTGAKGEKRTVIVPTMTEVRHDLSLNGLELPENSGYDELITALGLNDES